MNVPIRDCNGRGIGKEPKEYHPQDVKKCSWV